MRPRSLSGSLKLFTAGVLLFLSPVRAWAHMHIAPATARPGDDNENIGMGIKIDRPGTTGVPCGEASGAVPAANNFTAGGTATFTVLATIAHPGHLFISLATTNAPTQDSQFVPLALNNGMFTDAAGNKTPMVPLANIPFISTKLKRNAAAYKDLNTVGSMVVTVQIPANTVCNPTCTIQFVEQMEENPAAPSFYKSCMDVKVAAAAAGGTPTPTPTPTVAATPTPTPSSPVLAPTATPTPTCN